jgi:ssRNA-specific RNase YbeY (16S rRNA maturation enzyme)
MSVFLANEQADYRVDEPSLARLARLVMDAEGVEESEISLLLVNRSVMTDLNERYLG